ncbi:hypothetical protein OG455_24070 [Kitasatospora sp. NBC_01287]|uniref:hypothetical protein n=1 Tax=Kitasatospora sp. NBC_01287 TaxID=2903573 RepID=UPI00225221C8|nr:hypothetical protein [Kitasatospora sp. NBC_01287]MCX4748555.1 hypothetical protein [Kitasatospora sp. NBC_01287]
MDTTLADDAPQGTPPEADREPTARRGARSPLSSLRRAVRLTPYRVACLVLLLILVPIAAQLPWSGDIGQHASTIWRLRTNLAHPTSPMIDLPGRGSPYFSPYQLIGALVSLAIGWTPLRTLHLLAVGNVLLILVGIGVFVRALSSRPWAPVFAVLSYFFLWGTTVEVWSGYESFLSFSLGLSYPSAFAAGLMLLLWAGVLNLLGRVPERGPLPRSLAFRIPAHLTLGVVLFAIVLSHPFTGIVVCLGLAAIMLGSLRDLTRRDWLLWGGSAAVLLAGVLAWPYWSVWHLGDSAALDSVHQNLFHHPLDWFGFALLLGVPALVARVRRDRRDPLVWTFLLVAPAVGYGWFSGDFSWGRAYPGLILMLQLAVALEAARIPWSQWFKREFSLLLTLSLAFGIWVQAGAMFYLFPKSDFPRGVTDNVQAWEPWPGFQWTTEYLGYGDVVMTTGTRPLDMLPAYGYYTVAAGYPDPAIAQSVLDQRAHDTWVFFSKEATNGEKFQLLREYHAGWVLIRPEDGVVPRGPGFQVVAKSPQGEYLIKVTAP